MIQRLRLILLVISLLVFCGVAHAELVGTDEAAASLEPAKPDADREKLRAFMERPEVVEKLKSMGISPDQAQSRVAALSDAEVHAIAGKVDMLPAGGRLSDRDLLLIIIIILAVALLIIVL